MIINKIHKNIFSGLSMVVLCLMEINKIPLKCSISEGFCYMY